MAALALGLALGASPAFAAVDPGAVLPRPLSQTALPHMAAVRIVQGGVIAVPAADAEALAAALYLRDMAARTRGLRLVVRAGPSQSGRAAIRFQRDAAVVGGREAYDLSVADGQVTISAKDAPGLFYGAVTTWQLMTADAGRGPVSLAAEQIHDAPRFAWRGLMIDSARHYQSTDEIRRMIDWMALHKLNVLHWHLTDDQGWRLEIKHYPRLTEVGAWRVPAGAAAQADIDPATGQPRREGGFYSQDQVRAIVAYAAARQILIVPEIEMPGHALSAILAYPQLGSDGPAPAAIQSDWGVFPYLYNSDDTTFAFLQTVLSEVMDLFPSPYVHVGGDEAVKDQWKASPAIQGRIKALGLKDEDALQAWFTHRIDDYLIAHGRRLVGWDEILDGGPLPPSAVVMSWHGVDGAVTAAKAGHDAVVSPAPLLYFDNMQAQTPSEPPGRGFVVSLKDVYGFDPAPPSLTAEQSGHILGLQANLWTEHIRTDERLTAMAFPRAAAVAEAGWTAQSRRDWSNFAERLPVQFQRYHALGLAADEAGLAVRVEQSPAAASGRAAVNLSTQLGLGQIHYTLDGSAPSEGSAVYRQALDLPLPSRLRAAAFEHGTLISPLVDTTIDTFSIRRRASQELKSCSGKLVLNLEDDGPVRGDRARFLVDVMDPCWIYPQADLDRVSKMSVNVGSLPFNFQLGADMAKLAHRPPATAYGELEVRLDDCASPPIAVMPLPAPRPDVELTSLEAPLPRLSGRHDLCFTFTAKSPDPMSVLNWVQLVPDQAQAVSAKSGG